MARKKKTKKPLQPKKTAASAQAPVSRIPEAARTAPRQGSGAVHGFTSPRMAYEKRGDGNDPYARADAALTAAVFHKLWQCYPGHPWSVEADHEQGIVKLRLEILMKGPNWFILHINTLKTDPTLKAVMRAGGDMLERFALGRRGMLLDQFLGARDKVVPKPKRLLVPEAYARGPRPLPAALVVPEYNAPRERIVLN